MLEPQFLALTLDWLANGGGDNAGMEVILNRSRTAGVTECTGVQAGNDRCDVCPN